ncbi:MSHA biogenesis protein MshB, partial [Shewanella sp. 30m-9]
SPRNNRYTVRMQNGVGGSSTSIDGQTITGLDLCVYHQVATLALNQTSGVADPAPDLDTVGANGVTYNAGTGQVVSFTNN